MYIVDDYSDGSITIYQDQKMKEKITIPFYNDLLFKYFVYDNEDEGCQ